VTVTADRAEIVGGTAPNNPEASAVFVEQHGQVACSVQEADDLDVVAVESVEDQIAVNSAWRSRSNALSSRGPEFPRAARLRVLEKERHGIRDGVEQPLRSFGGSRRRCTGRPR
jgi:hypothetical protein